MTTTTTAPPRTATAAGDEGHPNLASRPEPDQTVAEDL